MTVLTGQSFKASAEFYNFEGELEDPAEVRFILYDSKFNKILEVILNENNRESVGKYFYIYKWSIEQQCTKLIYEFKGITEDIVSLSREEIWVKILN